MKNFKKLFDKYVEIEDELDNHIWTVFHRHLEITKTLFSHPSSWESDIDSILFSGSDGCMGCYDRMSYSIPLKFFINPDEELEKLAGELKAKKEKAALLEYQKVIAAEKLQLKKLKEKYEEKAKV